MTRKSLSVFINISFNSYATTGSCSSMKKRTGGQSMVEMALILPFLLLVVFGIIDLGYYIYGYASIYQAARNGAEKAAELPPFPRFVAPLRAVGPDTTETCVSNILAATQAVAGQFPDLTNGSNAANTITIS